MRFVSKLILFSFLVSSLSSCVNYEEVEITEIKKLRLLELTDKEFRVESEVRISNPNSFSIDVIESEFNVKVENKEIGKATIESKVELPSNSNDIHTIVLQSSLKDLKANALMNLMAITMGGKDDIRFEIDGHIVGKALLVKKKVEIQHKGIVPLALY